MRFPKLNNEIVDFRLKDTKIKRLDNYINSSTQMNWQCLDCFKIWTTKYNCIQRGTGCPICNKALPPLTNEIVDERLIGKNIKRLEDYKNIEYHYDIRKIHNSIKNKFYLDFYFPKLNIIIEYDGRQHFEPVQFGNLTEEQAKIAFKKQQVRDEKLNQICVNHNIKIIHIDGMKYSLKQNNIKEYLIKEILPILKEI